MAQVLLSNDEGNVGVVAVTLPIPDKEYSKTLDGLRELGIGDVRARDCYIDQIMDAPPVLDCLEGQTVNIDELDFLFRSIDRYTDDELAKFQAMAAMREIKNIEDLINLSFCSERATVITNFDDLESLGRRHYMTIHGGVCSVEQYDNLNGIGIARGLIASGKGTVTPYGVVYDNGMQLEELYTGQDFPAYADQSYMMELEFAPATYMPKKGNPAVVFLPTPEERLERLAERAGYGSTSEVIIQSWSSALPEAVNQAMYIPQEDLRMLKMLLRPSTTLLSYLEYPHCSRTHALIERLSQADGTVTMFAEVITIPADFQHWNLMCWSTMRGRSCRSSQYPSPKGKIMWKSAKKSASTTTRRIC